MIFKFNSFQNNKNLPYLYTPQIVQMYKKGKRFFIALKNMNRLSENKFWAWLVSQVKAEKIVR